MVAGQAVRCRAGGKMQGLKRKFGLKKRFQNLTQSHLFLFFKTKFPFQAPPDGGQKLATTLQFNLN
jgi:hypothetical protein